MGSSGCSLLWQQYCCGSCGQLGQEPDKRVATVVGDKKVIAVAAQFQRH